MTHSIAPQMSRLTPRRGSSRLIAHCDAINVVISNLDLRRNKQAIVVPKATAIFGKLENLKVVRDGASSKLHVDDTAQSLQFMDHLKSRYARRGLAYPASIRIPFQRVHYWIIISQIADWRWNVLRCNLSMEWRALSGADNGFELASRFVVLGDGRKGGSDWNCNFVI